MICSNAAVAGKSQLTLRLRRKDGKYGRLPTSSLDDGDTTSSWSGVMAVAVATCDGVVDDDTAAKVDVAFGVIESLLTDAATDGGMDIDLIDVVQDDDESKDIAFLRFLE